MGQGTSWIHLVNQSKHTLSCSSSEPFDLQASLAGLHHVGLCCFTSNSLQSQNLVNKRHKLKMSTDAWRTVWHPLGGKNKLLKLLHVRFFFSFFEVLHCQSTRTRLQKKRAVGPSFFVVVKGKNVLQVFVACYITPCFERKHLWWSSLLNSWGNAEAKPSNMRWQFLQILWS